jgi:hypothetical protein
MPCYEIRTATVQFRVENIDILKKALEKQGLGHYMRSDGYTIVANSGGYNSFVIDLRNGMLQSTSMNDRELADFSNSLKRTYSECVIDEISEEDQWFKNQLDENTFQLQRF